MGRPRLAPSLPRLIAQPGKGPSAARHVHVSFSCSDQMTGNLIRSFGLGHLTGCCYRTSIECVQVYVKLAENKLIVGAFLVRRHWGHHISALPSSKNNATVLVHHVAHADMLPTSHIRSRMAKHQQKK
jgi:hypothetical protein